ncbi:MAG: hypothetical protein ACI91G_001744, partial [Gammaproteobacteria bacterium]
GTILFGGRPGSTGITGLAAAGTSTGRNTEC